MVTSCRKQLKRRLLQSAAGKAIFTAGLGVSIITVITHGPAAARNAAERRRAAGTGYGHGTETAVLLSLDLFM